MPNEEDTLRFAVETLSTRADPGAILMGFDGFIDEIVHAVDVRIDPNTFQRIETMSSFGDRIREAAGLSCSIELVSQMTKLGGNGPIMANAMTRYRHQVTYAGALGTNVVAPVFREFASACDRVILLSEPAHTTAVEFLDGKVMLGMMGSLEEISWNRLLEHISREELGALVRDMDMIGFMNWTMLPNMNSLFEGFCDLLREEGCRPHVYIDLADSAKRPKEELLHALHLLSRFQEVTDVILGLNENESHDCAEVLGTKKTNDLTGRACRIRDRLGLSIVLIHPVSSAHAADADGGCEVSGPYTPDPKLTTGAGDVFNAGFCHGFLNGCGTRESLLCGVFSSGYYVRNCRSPDNGELIEFMKSWAENSPRTEKKVL